MATSGTTSLSATRNTIIRGAFRLLGFKKNGGVRPAQEVLDAEQSLNTMLKSWQAMDIGLWLNREYTLYTDKSTSTSYSIGPSGDEATLSPQETAIATAASSGATTIVVDSGTNIADDDNIGIVLDDGTLQWTTVSSGGTTTSIVIAAALTDDAAVDNPVYNYTTIAPRPLEIIEARLNNADGNDIIINIVSRNEYMDMTDKSSTGSPNQIYYDPQLTDGVMNVWPISDNVQQQIKFTGKVPIEIFSAHGNSPELPDEWMSALTYNLADWLIPEYPGRISPIDASRITKRAKGYLDTVSSFDGNSSSFFISPSRTSDGY